jgi:hypothetical protein
MAKSGFEPPEYWNENWMVFWFFKTVQGSNLDTWNILRLVEKVITAFLDQDKSYSGLNVSTYPKVSQLQAKI